MKNFVVLAALAIIAAVAVVFISEQYDASMDTGIDANKAFESEKERIILSSPEFSDGASIPLRYTCEGDNTSPELSWSSVPRGTVSFVLTMYDPDVPKALRPEGFFDHWVLFNIEGTVTGIPSGGTLGVPGANTRGAHAYTGPCPPSEYEPSEHRYIFTLYALDTMLPLQEGASRADVEAAIAGHVLGEGMFMGRYKKQHP